MSHHALQQLVVRMLFDEAFTAGIYADAERALSGEDLTESERSQLLAVDRRAWGYDALRRRRTLRTLAEEYRISTTIILAETRSIRSLDDFFSSCFFHDAVRRRGSLGMAFADFLQAGLKAGSWMAPQLADIVRLESALAGCRRSLSREGHYVPAEPPSTISDRARIRLAPGYGVGSYQAAVIEAIQRVEQYLFELNLMPAMALCDDAPRLTDLPEVDPGKKIYLSFGPGATGITLTNIDRQTYLVLYETRLLSEIRSVVKRAADAGIKQPRAQEILAQWIESGALIFY